MRFRLRTLMIAVAIFCVWLGLQVNRARQQSAAVRAIERLGGKVYYDYQFKRDRTGRNTIFPNTPFPYPARLRPVVEAVAPPAVLTVRLRDTAATDRDLVVLKFLPRVRELDLSNTRITDAGLVVVGKVRGLQILDLADTNISDEGLVVVGWLRQLQSLSFRGPSIGDRGVEHLKRLRLEHLSLWKTRVTDAGVRHLRGMTTLRSLVLDGTQVTDTALEDIGQLTNLEDWLGLTHTQVTDAGLPHLANLKQLKILNLIETKVSPDGLRDLRKALPKLDISPF